MKTKKHRAFLKWAGGKYSLAETINKNLPKADQLVEPFVGAGSVFLNTDFDSYILNDINPDLISLYQFIQNKPAELIKATKVLFCSSNNQENQYYLLREEFNTTQDPWTRAVLFLYLNRHGYNGLCRYSSKGRFNVPFGRYKRPYFPEEEMWYFSEKSKSATFTCLPFEDIFKQARKGQVIYCDPPYFPLSQSASFTSYAKAGFNFESQSKLANLAKKTASETGVPVLLSNHDTPDVRKLYTGAKVKSFEVKRTISRNGAKRTRVKEVLALFSPIDLNEKVIRPSPNNESPRTKTVL
ncbi:Dam family site-specific DNA-(adenine-N6)-methyltransferase [Alteromonas sp. 5E99-2]|uniref:Dam family site-specific DNA-(adenine-N6)-methyltransferase n=1 Tax=Alteromonas sp. 5E99-2 TaxID=2817683 RepID=UPI001A9A032F|nr:Dam family site-specific DNA-(adenine-N6)-methyltransferase [Alteromonas sp. 5E99-2]MBO1254640.1 Dam family site-specific DNA-(adenine-N6)-methyltransferase [Alteromonas sp. 5E99-2]